MWQTSFTKHYYCSSDEMDIRLLEQESCILWIIIDIYFATTLFDVTVQLNLVGQADVVPRKVTRQSGRTVQGCWAGTRDSVRPSLTHWTPVLVFCDGPGWCETRYGADTDDGVVEQGWVLPPYSWRSAWYEISSASTHQLLWLIIALQLYFDKFSVFHNFNWLGENQNKNIHFQTG